MLLQKEPIKELELSIKASGFKIALTKFKQEKIVFDASSLNRKKTIIYLLNGSFFETKGKTTTECIQGNNFALTKVDQKLLKAFLLNSI